MDKPHAILIRMPPEVYAHLVREAAEQTIKAGKQISINALVVSILETHFAKRGGKRG